MWKDELDIIIREKSAYGEKVNRGASESIITLLKDKAAAELHTELPDGYPEFLLAVNGIEFNGYIIYGVDSTLPGSEPEQSICGFVENNLVWYENEWQMNYVFIGESSISWYVYDPEDKKYKKLDKPSGRCIMEYGSFDGMVEAILHNSLQ